MLQTTTRGAVIICSLCRLTNQNSKPEALCLSLNILIIALYRFQRQCWGKEKEKEKKWNQSYGGDAQEREAGVSMKAFAVVPRVCLCSRPALCCWRSEAALRRRA